MTTETAWGRLVAALDGWRPPRGFRLHYAADERRGRLNVNVEAPCRGSFPMDFRLTRDVDVARLAGDVHILLDLAAFALLRDHICCQGRLPRAIRRAGRHFEAWADDYAFLSRYQAKGGRHQC